MCRAFYQRGTFVVAKEKLLRRQGPDVSDTAKQAFDDDLDFLIAWAWPLRASGVYSGAQQPPQPPHPPTPAGMSMSIGSYSPSNSNVFSPVLNIHVPSPSVAPNVAHTLTRKSEKAYGSKSGEQHAVTAYFPKMEKGGGQTEKVVAAVVDLSDKSKVSTAQVLKHFSLHPLERDNQRSSFINDFVDAARKCNIHSILGAEWYAASAADARESFEKAKAEGLIKVKDRGKKKRRTGVTRGKMRKKTKRRKTTMMKMSF